jgi:hypothetical protein
MRVSREQFIFGVADGVTLLSIAAAFWLGLAAWTLGLSVLLIAAAPILLVAGLLIWSGNRLRRLATGISRATFRNAPKGSSIRRIGIRSGIVSTAQTFSVGLVAFIVWTLHRPDLIWPLIGLVISLHFIPLGWIYSVRPYYVLGVLGTAVALASIFGFSGSMRTVAVGVGLGLVIGGCAVYLIANASALADATLGDRSSSAEVLG